MAGFQRLKPLPVPLEALFASGLLGATAFLWHTHGFGWEFFRQSIFFAFLWRIALLDVRHGLVFDRLVLPFAVLGISFAALFDAMPPASCLLAAFLAGGFLYLLRVVSGGGMGGGDVKLAFALGLWLGVEGVVVALFLAFLSGGIVASCLLLLGRQRDARIAFAPFLAFGALGALLFADELLAFYGGLWR